VEPFRGGTAWFRAAEENFNDAAQARGRAASSGTPLMGGRPVERIVKLCLGHSWQPKWN
jgi:hypothetical protein